VELDWNDNAEQGVGYNVYRSTTSTVDASGTPLNPTPLTASEYSDSEVEIGSTYFYAVVAVANGAMSAISNVATVTVTDPGTDPEPDPEPGAGEWRTLAPSSSNRQEVSYVQVGGRFYLAGGSTLHEVYDPVADTWSTIAPLPMNLDHIQGVTIDGLIYYIGGLSNWPGPHTSTVYIYNPETNSFRQGAAMPEGRGRGAGGVAVHGGKIYYAGGLHGSRAEARAVAWFDVYDPATNSWQALPDMPTARDHFHAAVVGGVFYAIGGRDKDIDATTAIVEAYTFASGSWSTLPTALPTERGGFAAAVVGDEIMIMGGEGGGNTYDTVEAYNTVTNTWRSLAAMPTARHGIQAAVCNGGVYLAAGGTVQGGQGPTSVHEVFFLNGPTSCENEPSEFTTINWSSAAPSPLRLSEAIGGTIDGKLYVFGGYSSFTPVTVHSDVHVYDPANNTWRSLAQKMPTPLTHGGTTVDVEGRNFYIAGGYVGRAGGGQIFATDEVWKYNVDRDEWTPMPPLPEARGSGGLALLDRKLHFFGGSDIRRRDKNEHWVLSLDNEAAGWSRAAPLLRPINHLGAVTLGGKIYTVGGQQGQDGGSTTQSFVSVWDPATDTWAEVASLPQPLSHISGTTFVKDNRIIVVGGEIRHNTPVADVWAYDPAADAWTPLTPLPAKRRSGVARGIGGQIIFATGSDPGFRDTTYRGIPTN
jgi:N-acetylneuraminic acid mutarotase